MKKEKISLRQQDEKGYWYGKHLSEETKQKIKNNSKLGQAILKLTIEDAREIRKMYMKYIPIKMIAQKYNVSERYIGRVIRGEEFEENNIREEWLKNRHKNKKTKLTIDDVKNIKLTFKQNLTINISELTIKYKVGENIIKMIKDNKTWKQVKV